ncbi:MAG TPA: hypothetical protein GX723_05545 [Thermoanaerobacterales bacterium]|nr:hypothetical protein [Thermoanaerobacterales bacterium]
MKKSLIIILVLILILLITACANTSMSSVEEDITPEEEVSKSPQSGGTINLAVTSLPNLNPLMAEDYETKSILSLIYEGLVRIDEDGSIQPNLAVNWQITDEGRTYIFNLRKEVKWQNGETFSSSDVKATFDKIVQLKKQPRNNRPDFYEFDNIQSYEAIDEETFTITLYKPDTGFLYHMDRGILPASILEKPQEPNNNDKTIDLSEEYVGTGPYKVVGLERDSISLKRNNYYSDKSYIKEINIKAFPDNYAIIEAFKNQLIDLVSIESEDWDIFQDIKNVYLLQCPSRYFEFLSLNLNNPIFSDVKVRQAMLMAIDRDEILQDTTLGRGIVIDGPILPFSWVFNSQIQHITSNKEEAEKILEEAGWKDEDGDGILERTIGNTTYKFEFELLVNTANVRRYQTALHIQKDLEALGISVKLVNTSWQELENNVLNKRYDAAIMGWKLKPNPDLRFMFASNEIKNGYNFVSYSNEELDNILIQAQTNYEGKRELLYKAQEIISQDLPYLFLYSPNKLLAINNRLQGVKPDPVNLFNHINEWWIEQ